MIRKLRNQFLSNVLRLSLYLLLPLNFFIYSDVEGKIYSGGERSCKHADLPRAQSAPKSAADDPWTDEQIIEPDQLAKIVAATGGRTLPDILYIGPAVLYKRSHIPHARFAGTASQSEGLKNLIETAKSLKKENEIVLYCGCCPWDVCPNIRPAFKALRDLGFQKVRVLHLPNTFRQDWVGRGFPTVAGE